MGLGLGLGLGLRLGLEMWLELGLGLGLERGLHLGVQGRTGLAVGRVDASRGYRLTEEEVVAPR